MISSGYHHSQNTNINKFFFYEIVCEALIPGYNYDVFVIRKKNSRRKILIDAICFQQNLSINSS